MTHFLLFSGIVIILCLFMNRFTDKIPVPSLIFFLLLGMCFGVDGLLRIPFDDYSLSETICSTCLVFIMFYGGFGTNLKAARPVAAPAFLLSTIGVVLTAALVGVFVHGVFGLDWLPSFLIGSVISSTDAASVFSVLRSQKLALKNHTDSMLELESGSNDPVSYMLTILLVAVMTGRDVSVPMTLFLQLALGIAGGILIGWLAEFFLNHYSGLSSPGRTIFLFSTALIAYALPAVLGGNGYLSVYFCGIFLGNHYLPEKRAMVHFFDVLTEVSQMAIFFLLGLLVTPSNLPQVFLPALMITLVLTFAARPLSVAAVLLPFRVSLRQIGLVSFAGLRGVASIVFSIYVVLEGVSVSYNLFNLVFVIVLLSLSFQGTLLPLVSRKLDMIDPNTDVLKTFNDYQEESDVAFVKVHISRDHPYTGKQLKNLTLPKELLAVLLLRREQTLLPSGDTLLQEGDLLVLAAPEFTDRSNLTLHESVVSKNHRLNGKLLKDLPKDNHFLIIMIKRGDSTIIPNGNTRIQAEDVLVFART
ncbi:MAG TPA: potassium/proton antiporter [Candidatus Blautia merdavium]|uniref:Potassium/proton antiporter n=1 Tax=Candidatus Blautia merdavium TaxID=2838494 RepID=A0A9D2TAZ3_9FIRM|nr:potassium/proton antiporter [Candidatus Blautia merdavium]